jgi:hypothetical protein
MQSEQSKECSVFSYHKIGANNNHTVSYPNAITSQSYDVIQNRYDNNRSLSQSIGYSCVKFISFYSIVKMDRLLQLQSKRNISIKICCRMRLLSIAW